MEDSHLSLLYLFLSAALVCSVKCPTYWLAAEQTSSRTFVYRCHDWAWTRIQLHDSDFHGKVQMKSLLIDVPKKEQ